MADTKNEQGKTPSTEAQTGSGQNGGRISAGTSVGTVGQSPMPHAQEGAKPAQSSTLASHTSKPLGGRENNADRSRDQSARQGQHEQGGPMTEKAQEMAAQTGEKVRETTDEMRRKAGEAYEGASEWAEDTYERVSDWASDAYEHRRERMSHMRDRSMRTLGNVRGGVQHYVAENPMVVGLVGLAAGLLIGALLPRTRRENEAFGEWSDEVRNQGLRYARDAAERGREYVEEAFSGEEPRFSRHESEFDQEGPPAGRH